ncbi:MAG TPA: type I-E CRISPR-associated protein Cas7/Cse4/CasC [Streptomyces sp.]
MNPLFIDIHVLFHAPFSNLNRDEYGSPKMALQGGAERIRVSSANQKRGTRIAVEKVLGDRALRTRRIPEKAAEILRARGWDEAEAVAAGQALALAAGISGVAITDSGLTNVMLYVPESALESLANVADTHRALLQTAAEQARAKAAAKNAAKQKKSADEKETDKQLKALGAEIREILTRRNGSIAAFGRMLANSPESTVDGAICVAHAVTTHAAEEQPDFFTAVDDLPGVDIGSAHMGQRSYASGTFYKYATVSVPELVRNLDGDRTMARELTAAFLTSFARYIPQTEQRGTAPFTPPALVHLTVRTDQPVNLGGAFEAPVTTDHTSGWIAPSITALDLHAKAVNAFYGTQAVPFRAHNGTAALPSRPASLGPHIPLLDDLVAAALDTAFPATETA